MPSVLAEKWQLMPVVIGPEAIYAVEPVSQEDREHIARQGLRTVVRQILEDVFFIPILGGIGYLFTAFFGLVTGDKYSTHQKILKTRKNYADIPPSADRLDQLLRC